MISVNITKNQLVNYDDTDFDKVLFEKLSTKDGKILGVITLNEPKALNSASLEMCQAIFQTLNQWQNDSQIVAVFLQGTGEKAFCAGGNIRKLYEAMIAQPIIVDNASIIMDEPNYFTTFFRHEYQLNHYMATYPKPIIAWATGIVMGGGLGLVATCSHRIVTETTRFAMPEINIGLFPDATGSWFLQKMPAQVGLFFGLTGANGNAKDALLLNLAEFAMKSEDRQNAIDGLLNADWHSQKTAHAIVSHALSQLHTLTYLADSKVIKHWQTIQTIVNQGDMLDIDKALKNPALRQQFADDDWFTQAIDTYEYGCPVTAHLTYEFFVKAKMLSLAEILQLEFNVAVHCCYYADFREGVRALIVDKDKKPNWSRAVENCDKSYILSHFEPIMLQGKALQLSL